MTDTTTNAFWDELEKICNEFGFVVPQVARRPPPLKPPPSAAKDIRVPHMKASEINVDNIQAPKVLYR